MKTSIALYGERPYNLDIGLTRHEKAWIEELCFESYLSEIKRTFNSIVEYPEWFLILV